MTKFYFLLLIGIHAEDLETGSSKLKESKGKSYKDLIVAKK
jgi:hypothetical protein